ncbi:MAG: GerMN domain-containing protein [Candidatus Kerfeldbacteria bacterium]|nr:GerMN domain-containing protein [Candidatus Kerfeldbacteria bacterium]
MPKKQSNSNMMPMMIVTAVAVVIIVILIAVMLHKPTTSTTTNTNTIVNTSTRTNTNLARNTNTSTNKNTNSATNANTNSATNSNTNRNANVVTNTNASTHTNTSTNTNSNANTNSTVSSASEKNTNTVQEDAEGNKTLVVDLYMIDIGNDSGSDETIGCGDSMAAVERTASVTGTSLDGSVYAAVAYLLALHNNPQYGYYNALYQSSLEVDSVSLSGDVASVYLAGTITLGGTCDTPRFESQLTSTITQFPDVNEAKVYINGTLMSEALSSM